VHAQGGIRVVSAMYTCEDRDEYVEYVYAVHAVREGCIKAIPLLKIKTKQFESITE